MVFPNGTGTYLVVSLEKEKTIDFDELTSRLLEEELKVDPGMKMTALSGNNQGRKRCFTCGDLQSYKSGLSGS